MPGRETDVKDAEWIADLVRHGLIALLHCGNCGSYSDTVASSSRTRRRPSITGCLNCLRPAYAELRTMPILCRGYHV
jgi:hypothetical protein